MGETQRGSVGCVPTRVGQVGTQQRRGSLGRGQDRSPRAAEGPGPGVRGRAPSWTHSSPVPADLVGARGHRGRGWVCSPGHAPPPSWGLAVPAPRGLQRPPWGRPDRPSAAPAAPIGPRVDRAQLCAHTASRTARRRGPRVQEPWREVDSALLLPAQLSGCIKQQGQVACPFAQFPV